MVHLIRSIQVIARKTLSEPLVPPRVVLKQEDPYRMAVGMNFLQTQTARKLRSNPINRSTFTIS